MSTIPTQIKIDLDIKEQPGVLFSGLGLDMSCAVNMFLHQCALRGGIPFSIEILRYKQSTLASMEEARSISCDPNVASYDNMDELKRASKEYSIASNSPTLIRKVTSVSKNAA